MFTGFKKFILRGNVVDLAVGIMIGAAFNGVVSALVKDIFTPLIAAIWQESDFANLSFTIRGSKVLYGDFLNNVISFLILALTVYFAVVLPLNKYEERHHGPTPPPTTKPCPFCATDIPISAKRCPHCTSQLG